MKKFLKFLAGLTAVFSSVLVALAVFDRLTQKNRIKNGYLECDMPDDTDN